MIKKYDVIGIGSPLLDLTFEVNDILLNELGLKKGQMKLIDKNQSSDILAKLKDYKNTISPGGSASNTISGISCLGGKAIFAGKLGNDSHGKTYEERIKEEGITSSCPIHPDEITGHAIALITPDFERTFATHLGASQYFEEKDIPEEMIKDSKILHLEGYQLANDILKSAVYRAVKIAKENQTLVSLDLSDAGLVRQNLDLFKDFIREYVDIVFANESEALAFTGKKDEDALIEISKLCDIAIVKLGEGGSLIRKDNNTYKIPSYKTKVVNTNGAGDMYSAGMLYGIVNDWHPEKSGKIASYSASLVVGKPEARYGEGLKLLIDKFISENNL